MLYTLGMTLLTGLSTFMAADTFSHVSGLQSCKVASAMQGIWFASVVLSLLDGEWLTLLGFVHLLIFVLCGALTYVMYGAQYVKTKDFIKLPLLIYVPLFIVLSMMHQISSEANDANGQV